MIFYFDICAAIILCVLIFSVFFRGMTGGLPNRTYIVLVSVTLAATLFDILTIAVPYRENTDAAWINYGAHIGYLALRSAMVPIYILYLISLTDTWFKLKNSMAFKVQLIIPYAAIIIALLLNGFNGAIFGYNDDGSYRRGSAIAILYVCSLLYLIFGIVYLFKYKRLFTLEKLISLFAIFPLTAAAVIVQLFHGTLLVEMFASALALLLIIITVQRPEELLDFLTGLGKYDAYCTDMKKNFSNGKRVGVIMVNISNYSSIHAMLGLDNLNMLLKNVASMLVAINKNEKLHADLYYLDRGRYRFVVSEEHWDKLDKTAEKVNFELKQSVIFNHMALNLIVFVCIAHCPEEITGFEPLMAFGNELNEMPYTGQVLKTSEISEKNRFKLSNELNAIIDGAIANRSFEVYYQPIYSIKDKSFISAEALLRLKHEKYGFISPEIFIPAAEKSGAIHKIGEMVLEDVCRFISSSEYKSLGLKYIEINLSVAQCMQTDLADNILQIMKRYGVKSNQINLEITETAASYSQNIMMENLDKLTEAGVEFSLDDYGTGYSNIKSVASLPIKIVKLDKTFVDNESNPRMWIVLKNTIKMLKDMNMHIVVEGIETEGLMKKFADLECEYIQGYYYSKPIPENDFISFIKKHSEKKSATK